MKVLFVGGGRRVSLAQIFKSRGYKLFAYELSEEVPVSLYADVIRGYSWYSPFVDAHLQYIVDSLNIDLVLPLMDAAIGACANLKGCVSIASASNAMCTDKAIMEDRLQMIFPGNYPYAIKGIEAIIKPRYGFGARNIYKVESFSSCPDGYIAQRKLNGLEYSVDSYFNPKGEWVDSVPRLREKIMGSEVQRSITTDYLELVMLTKAVGEALGTIGPTNTQFIVENKPYILEINARFGGGYPLSIKAGLDVISLIERDYFNKPFKYVPNTWKRKLVTDRYLSEFFYEL